MKVRWGTRVEKAGPGLGHRAGELASPLRSVCRSVVHGRPPQLRAAGKCSPEPAATFQLQPCTWQGEQP